MFLEKGHSLAFRRLLGELSTSIFFFIILLSKFGSAREKRKRLDDYNELVKEANKLKNVNYQIRMNTVSMYNAHQKAQEQVERQKEK